MTNRVGRWGCLALGACLALAGCTGGAKAPSPPARPRALPLAPGGRVVVVMGDGQRVLPDADSPAWLNHAGEPAALALAPAGGLLAVLGSGREVDAVAADGTVRLVADARNGLDASGWGPGLVALPGGAAAMLGYRRLDAARVRLAVSKVPLAGGGPVASLGRLDLPDRYDPARPPPVGLPGLAALPGGGLLVVWDGRAWTVTGGRLRPAALPVRGARRAVADGADLLVGTDQRLFRVRAGRVVGSAPLELPGRERRGSELLALVPDGKGGAYAALDDPAVVHVARSGTVSPVLAPLPPGRCGSGFPAPAREAPLALPVALALRAGQLYIADYRCSLVLATGVG